MSVCDATTRLGDQADVVLFCHLPNDHGGPHFDRIDRVSWRVAISRAIPRITQTYLEEMACD